MARKPRCKGSNWKRGCDRGADSGARGRVPAGGLPDRPVPPRRPPGFKGLGDRGATTGVELSDRSRPGLVSSPISDFGSAGIRELTIQALAGAGNTRPGGGHADPARVYDHRCRAQWIGREPDFRETGAGSVPAFPRIPVATRFLGRGPLSRAGAGQEQLVEGCQNGSVVTGDQYVMVP